MAGRPSLDERYVRPQTAWEKMKAAQTARQTVYIYGVTGTGKTSFVVDFLGRRRYSYLSMAESPVSELTGLVREAPGPVREKERAGKIVVLDDLHALESQEDRAVCGQYIDALSARPDVWLVLCSRAPVPRWLKSTYVRHIFVPIGEEQLCLSHREQERYMDQWELAPTEACWKAIRDMDCGHPLYLRIAALRLRAIPAGAQGNRPAEEVRAIDGSRQDFWDYLDSHVFDQWNVELQEFLEAVSVVDWFDLQMARQITKNQDAGRLILQAQETGNFFTERWENGGSVYAQREPMKNAMRRRLATKHPKSYIDKLYCSAGNCYELEGDFAQALKMYETCGEEEGISRVLIANTRRNPASGDYIALKRFYLTLPEEKVRQSVELMAGMSMLHSMIMDGEESERW